MTNQTAMSEILESLRAIRSAAKERHAALLAEAAELEGAFPELRLVSEPLRRVGRPMGSRLNEETRRRMSEAAKARWVARRSASTAGAIQ